jgi:hypothetical protein
MTPSLNKIRLNAILGIAMLLGAFATAQDIKLNVTCVCSARFFRRTTLGGPS